MKHKWLIAAFIMNACTLAGLAQKTTIRIRFANGKTGQPLHLKSYDRGTLGPGGNYSVERVDGDSLIVIFDNISTFAFRSEAFDPCDTKSKRDPLPKYSLQEIVAHGVVAPNYCGKVQAKPIAGELLIYSRHQHWWEITGNIAKGLLICA